MHGRTRLVIEGLPNTEYHRCPALSRSGIKDILKSPAHFNAKRNPDPSIPPARVENEEAMDYGSLVHTLVLEPERASDHVVGPDVATRAAKAWKEALLGLPEGKQLVHPIDWHRAQLQAQVIRGNPHYAEHAARAQRWSELSFFWRDHVTDVWLMCRTDSLALVGLDDEVEIVDLKTTKDASPWSFAKACVDFAYDLQCAMYSAGVAIATGLRVTSFLIIASESSYPFVTEAYTLDAAWVGAAEHDARKGIDRYAQCKRVDQWPTYTDGSVQLLKPPAWRARQIELASV